MKLNGLLGGNDSAVLNNEYLRNGIPEFHECVEVILYTPSNWHKWITYAYFHQKSFISWRSYVHASCRERWYRWTLESLVSMGSMRTTLWSAARFYRTRQQYGNSIEVRDERNISAFIFNRSGSIANFCKVMKSNVIVLFSGFPGLGSMWGYVLINICRWASRRNNIILQ